MCADALPRTSELDGAPCDADMEDVARALRCSCETDSMSEKVRSFIRSERWDAFWLFVLTKALVVIAAVPLALAWKARTGGGIAFLVTLTVALYLIAFVLDGLVKVSERSRKTAVAVEVANAKTATTNQVCNAFSGIPQHTAGFLMQVRSGDPEMNLHLHRYFAEVMEGLIKGVSAREPRACLYLVEGAESPDGGDDSSVTLILSGNGVGRADPPRSAFDSTTSYGQYLIQRMNERRVLVVEDTTDPPGELADVLDCSDKYYKSFVAVPVTYNDHEYGMLMIDSPEPHGLTRDNQAIAHLFGRFLGSGLHMVQSSPASLPRAS